MRGPLVVVTRPGEGLGFRLTGVPVWEIPVGEEAARLGGLAEDTAERPALVIIEDDVQRALPEALVARIERRGLPVLFPFALPRRTDARNAEDYVGTLVRRAIGFHVRLER
jgi:V/A-type H+-transporting ATPase subunit F